MAISHVLLGLLVDGPAHGYDLKRLHDARFEGARPLAFGQVYAALARLQKDDLVEVAEVVVDGGPERITYAITQQGRAELDQWLGAPEPAGPYSADELVRKVVTALSLGQGATELLLSQREQHLAEMKRLVELQDSLTDTAARIALDHAVLHLDADLRWLETASERIRHAERTPR